MNKVWSPGGNKWVKVKTLEPKNPKKARVRRRARTIRRGWVKLPRSKMIELVKATRGHTGPALVALMVLDFLVYETKSNVVKFTNDLVRELGFERQTKRRGLSPLEQIGAISVDRSGPGAPVITHHWYDHHGNFIGCD
jgi:hypothetical protein